jgi:hypothetical protein
VSDRLGGPGRRAGPPPEPRAADQQLRAQANAQASSRGRRPPRLQRPRLPGAPLSALSGARRARCRSRLGHRGSHVDAGLGAVDGGCRRGAARVRIGGVRRSPRGRRARGPWTGCRWCGIGSSVHGARVDAPTRRRCARVHETRVHADLRGSSVHDFRARRPPPLPRASTGLARPPRLQRPRLPCTPTRRRCRARPRDSRARTSAAPASTTWINSGGSWIPPPRGLLRMREEKFDNVDRARHSRTKKNLTARVQYASDTA